MTWCFFILLSVVVAIFSFFSSCDIDLGLLRLCHQEKLRWTMSVCTVM